MSNIDEVLSELVRDIIRKECREQLDTAFRAGNHVSLAAIDEKIDKVAQVVDARANRIDPMLNNHENALVELRDNVTALAEVLYKALNSLADGGSTHVTGHQTGGTNAEFRTCEVKVKPGYECLFDVLVAALEQAQSGKGAERHANDQPFSKQPMQSVADATGSIDGILFQMMKKARESTNMPLDRAVRELLGSIVYAAGAVIWRQRHADDEQS